MIDRVGKALRPVSLLTRSASPGRRSSARCTRGSSRGPRTCRPTWRCYPEDEPSRTVASEATGAVLAFDEAGLVELARRADCLIELVPQVGDFVTTGDPLFRLYRGGEAISDRQLQQAVAVGPGAHPGAGPGVRLPHRRRHRLQGPLARHQRPDHRRAGARPAPPAARGRCQAAARHRAGPRRATGSSGWPTARPTGMTSSACRSPRSGSSAGRASRSSGACGPCWRTSSRSCRPSGWPCCAPSWSLLSRGVEQDFRDPEDRLRATSADSLGVGGAR